MKLKWEVLLSSPLLAWTPDLFAEYREDGLFSHPDLYLYSGQFRLRRDALGRRPFDEQGTP